MFFQKYSKKFISSFMYKKTIKECPVPLDISIKSNRKHHKTVLYSKSNKNMVGRLFGRFCIVFGRFFNRNIWSPCSLFRAIFSKSSNEVVVSGGIVGGSELSKTSVAFSASGWNPGANLIKQYRGKLTR
jgi:hypothetical protein